MPTPAPLRRYEVGLNQEHDVLIDLTAPTRYVIFTPEQAMEFAAYLIAHAKKSRKYKGKIQ